MSFNSRSLFNSYLLMRKSIEFFNCYETVHFRHYSNIIIIIFLKLFTQLLLFKIVFQFT